MGLAERHAVERSERNFAGDYLAGVEVCRAERALTGCLDKAAEMFPFTSGWMRSGSSRDARSNSDWVSFRLEI